MIAYKLVRKLKDGNVTPLFINKSFKIPFNTWLEAESLVFGEKSKVFRDNLIYI
jgi:hypothetical protein